MTRKEHDYLASIQRFETHEKQVQSLEAECREAKKLLRSPVPSVQQSNGGSDDERGEDGKDSVSDTEINNIEDVDNELHDLDLIELDTCNGDPTS